MPLTANLCEKKSLGMLMYAGIHSASSLIFFFDLGALLALQNN